MDDMVNYKNLSYRGLYIKRLKALEPVASTALAPETPANGKPQAAGKQ